MEVKIFTGSLENLPSLQEKMALALMERALETAEDGGPRGSPKILGMCQSHAAGAQVTITVVYEYRK